MNRWVCPVTSVTVSMVTTTRALIHWSYSEFISTVLHFTTAEVVLKTVLKAAAWTCNRLQDGHCKLQVFEPDKFRPHSMLVLMNLNFVKPVKKIT